jgi:RNA recognition motif-containing protein
MNIYVGNLSFDATEEALREHFESFGELDTVTIIRDKYDGRSRGFGFIEMPHREEAQKAIDELDGKDFMGRTLRVNEARPRQDRNRGGGGGRRRGGGGFNERW